MLLFCKGREEAEQGALRSAMASPCQEAQHSTASSQPLPPKGIQAAYRPFRSLRYGDLQGLDIAASPSLDTEMVCKPE